MNRLGSLFAFVLALSVSRVDAAPVELTLTGYGANPAEAVSQALVEAVRQTEGVAIDAREVQSQVSLDAHASGGADTQNRTVNVGERQGSVKLDTRGIVQRYRVLSVETGDDGMVRAEVQVQFERYEPPGISAENRRKLAVMQFRAPKTPFRADPGTLSGSELARRLAQQLTVEFTQSRRFSVADRAYEQEYAGESALLRSGDADTAELAKLGRVMGVDYMVVGSIPEASITAEEYVVPVLHELRTRWQARMNVEFRVMVMANRQVKWAARSEVVLDDFALRTLLKTRPPSAIVDKLVQTAAADIAAQTLENIYPVRVIKVRPSGELVLNQGGVTLRPGDVYDVFTEGEELFDPYTKESLGKDETQVGRARIERNNSKVSIATLVQGNVAAVSEGALLRRPQQKAEPAVEKPRTRVTTPAF